MMDTLRPVLLQASFFGALGLGAHMVRRMSAVPLHPLVEERCEGMVRTNPSLAEAASKVAFLYGRDDASLAAMLDDLNSILSIDDAKGLNAMWKMNRMIGEVVRRAYAMCSSVPMAESDAQFRAVMEMKQEAIPQLKDQLDDLLHNHLLSR